MNNYGKDIKGGKTKKYVIVTISVILVLILAVFFYVNQLNSKKNIEFEEIVDLISGYDIEEFEDEQEDLIDEWEDTEFFDISKKEEVLEELDELEKEVKEVDEWFEDKLEELTVIDNEKENYSLTEAFEEYEEFINDYFDVLNDRDYKEAKEYDDEYEEQLNKIIEQNNNYISERIEAYELIDLSTADISDKENFDAYLDEITESADKNIYNNIPVLIEELDGIAALYVEPEKELAFEIQQIDALDYPNVRLYAHISDAITGEVPVLESPFFFVRKEDLNANYVKQTIKTVKQLNELEVLNIGMVADVSGSMYGQPLLDAKQIMSNFISSVQFSAGDLVELISFSTGVHIEQEFTNSSQVLINKVNGLYTEDMTSLYDALYTAVTRVAGQSGAKCVIAFTDGHDNTSNCRIQEVIDTANRYHVPIFIIGISCNEYSEIVRIAAETGGECYEIENISSMAEIYSKIYKQQKEMYMIEFEDNAGNMYDESNVVVGYNSSEYGGKTNYTYTPNVLLSVDGDSIFVEGPEKVVEDYMKAFDDAMTNMDFSYISKYLKTGSNIYNSQEKYVQRNIEEILDLYEIVWVEYSNDDSCVVTTRETYYVQVEDKPLELLTQECKYIVERENGEWKIVDFAAPVNVISRVYS